MVVANDIKVEAQQELRALRRQLQEEQDRNAKLSTDLEALQGVRYNLHRTPLVFPVPPTSPSSFPLLSCGSLSLSQQNVDMRYQAEYCHILSGVCDTHLIYY